MEGLQTPDGKPLDLEAANRDFAKAMSVPPPDDLPAPPKRSETAGRAAAQKPESNSKPKQAAKPRTKPAAPVKADYTDDVKSVVTTTWAITAGVPLAHTQAFAFVLSTNADALTSALAEGCKHSESMRQMFTSTSEHTWKVQLAAVAAQMGMQTLQVMRDPELRDKAAEQTRAQLAQLIESASEVAADGSPPDA